MAQSDLSETAMYRMEYMPCCKFAVWQTRRIIDSLNRIHSEGGRSQESMEHNGFPLTLGVCLEASIRQGPDEEGAMAVGERSGAKYWTFRRFYRFGQKVLRQVRWTVVRPEVIARHAQEGCTLGRNQVTHLGLVKGPTGELSELSCGTSMLSKSAFERGRGM